ncbi:A disintegrin and metalloproteinase with thrombospondin motifs 18-like isoform X1 [Mercenaria mercenaria]|uniref:A disintegrin and metalloproteinase with thrombospondin motifs 18-like isoform X1 n=1 Tax=Mercenaria mercenaria TaxID=6596 RepID=UPI00234EFAC4|nr:A disintegrin and metalloproteinase with thrombospondin motifs 18-like isoform X1 [Mercenaria mercenaria]
MTSNMFFTMLFKRISCVIPVVLLLIDALATSVGAQENQKQRHEGHHQYRHIPNERWDIWSEWSPCSVDCGTGVTTRSRDCRSTLTGTFSEACIGKGEEIKVCEITGCLKQVEQSCRELEVRVYGGKRYRWIPYTHPSRECEMACRPIGAGFYLGLGRNVSDGTPCGDLVNEVCIAGQCKSIGCDGVVESEATVDSCGVCGGEGDTCKRIHKTFTDNVKFGYSTIATIPRGSANILIRELANTRNYLVIKATDGSFQINAAYRLSRFGDYPAAGTMFTYDRQTGPDCPDECIRADGPTDVSIEVMILAYTDNTGIEYSYSVPTSYVHYDDSEEDMMPVVYIEGGRIPSEKEVRVNSVNGDKKRPIFSHDFKFKKNKNKPVHVEHEGVATDTNKVDNQHGMESTQSTLDTGQNKPDVETTTTSNSEIIVEEIAGEGGDSNETIIIETENGEDISNRTDALQAPKSGVITEEGEPGVTIEDMYNNDNRIPSLYSWTVSGYSVCSATCGQGKQTPNLECIVTDKKVKVNNTFCSGEEKPAALVKECNYGPCPASWKPGQWSKCSVSCGTGYQTRQYVCTRTNGEQVSRYECGVPSIEQEEKSCDMGSCTSGWYYTEWPERCPVTCAYGTISRDVHCFSDTGNERTACPEREKPESEKSCRNDDCGGFWLTGPWSKCNGTCGMAYQNREIACASKRYGGRVTVVSESACVNEERPATYMSCDFKPCQPDWYMNDWGQCSVTCGSGQRSRDIRCLDSNMQTSSSCDPAKKPADRELCTQRRCPLADESMPADNTNQRTDPPPAPPAPPKQGPVIPGCKDKFSQCRMVLQARLCQYKYYQRICCASCESLKRNT